MSRESLCCPFEGFAHVSSPLSLEGHAPSWPPSAPPPNPFSPGAGMKAPFSHFLLPISSPSPPERPKVADHSLFASFPVSHVTRDNGVT